MLQPLFIPDAYFWSQPDPDLSLPAHGYLIKTRLGNAVINPVALDEDAHRTIERLGGVAKIIATTPDTMRESLKFSERYGASIIREPDDMEAVLPGIVAIHLPNQQTDTEFALNLEEHRTVIVGASILGTPAGSISMLPDSSYADPRKAALSLRRLLSADPDTLLLGHGQSVFTGAYDALYRLLYRRLGGEVHRINIDELHFRSERDEHEVQPPKFECLDAEVGFTIGARKLGYRVTTLAPGKVFCPLHAHAREEEMFFVLEGEPSVRTLSGTVQCRKGDFFALPVGETGTHQLLNLSKSSATVLLLGGTEDVETCYYPDSDKLLVDTGVPILNGSSSIMVQGSPTLPYFYGE